MKYARVMHSYALNSIHKECSKSKLHSFAISRQMFLRQLMKTLRCHKCKIDLRFVILSRLPSFSVLFCAHNGAREGGGAVGWCCVVLAIVLTFVLPSIVPRMICFVWRFLRRVCRK